MALFTSSLSRCKLRMCCPLTYLRIPPCVFTRYLHIQNQKKIVRKIWRRLSAYLICCTALAHYTNITRSCTRAGRSLRAQLVDRSLPHVTSVTHRDVLQSSHATTKYTRKTCEIHRSRSITLALTLGTREPSDVWWWIISCVLAGFLPPDLFSDEESIDHV